MEKLDFNNQENDWYVTFLSLKLKDTTKWSVKSRYIGGVSWLSVEQGMGKSD